MFGDWDANQNMDGGKECPAPFFVALRKFEQNNEEKVLQSWLKQAFEFCREFYKPYLRNIQENVAIYQGLRFDQKGQSRQEYEAKTYPMTPGYIPTDESLITNYVYEMTEEIVSSATTFKPSIAVIPSNYNQLEDLINAESIKQLIDSKFYELRYDTKHSQWIRNTKLAGEGWFFITWDKNAGAIAPAFKDAQAIHGGKVPLLDEHGQQVEQDGKKVFIEKPVRIGDVNLKLRLAENVFPEPLVYSMQDNWIISYYYERVEVLREDYPDKSESIVADKGGHWSYDLCKMIEVGKVATVIEMFHRDSPYVPGGFYLKGTTETLLEHGPLYYKHGEYPCESLTDMDVPGVIRGISYLRNTTPLQKKINHLRYLIDRNMKLVSHPKWFVEIGSISKKHLAAMPGIVPVVPGMKSPELKQFQSTHPEIYQYLNSAVDEIRTLSGVHPISTGTPPAGIRSGIALNLLKAEENQRNNSFITKINDGVLRVARKLLSTTLQNYKPEDQRIIRVLGQNNDYVYKMLDKAMIETPYDVRLQNQNALGDTKAAQVAGMMELFDKGAMTVDELRENVGLSLFSTNAREATDPIKTALWENEQLIKGLPVEVEFYDDHAKHYKIHYRQMQEESFRKLDPALKGSAIAEDPNFGQGYIGHIMTHVMLMVQEIETEQEAMAMSGSPGMSPRLQQYSMLPGFTLFSKTLMPKTTPQQGQLAQAPMPEGSSFPSPGGGNSRGNGINGGIAGFDPNQPVPTGAPQTDAMGALQ